MRAPNPPYRGANLKHQVSGGIDQVHVVEVGVKPHRLTRPAGGRRLDASADLVAVHGKEHHRLHSHRLDHVERYRELAARVASFPAWLRDMLRPQPEGELLAR